MVMVQWYAGYCDAMDPPGPPRETHPEECVFDAEFGVFIGHDGDAKCWYVYLPAPYIYGDPDHPERNNAFGTTEGQWIYVVDDWHGRCWAKVHGLWWKLQSWSGSPIRARVRGTWITLWNQAWYHWKPSNFDGEWEWVYHCAD